MESARVSERRLLRPIERFDRQGRCRGGLRFGSRTRGYRSRSQPCSRQPFALRTRRHRFDHRVSTQYLSENFL
jgi:hypothetical protein